MKRLSILLFVLLMLTACLPTPDEEAVINRRDGALEQAIVSTPVPAYTYEAPERWEETYKIREQEVRIAADVEVPDADQFPVATIQRRSFTANDINALLHAICPGDWEIRENEYSREELTVDLQNAAKGDYMGDDDGTGEPIWVPNEEEMKRIQGLIEQAPAEDSYKVLNVEELPDPVKTVAVRDSKETKWYLFAKSSSMRELISLKRYRDGNIQMENWVMQGEATPGEPPHALENIRISEEDAIRVGDEMIAAMGLTNMQAAEAQRARCVQSYSYNVLGEGYYLTYVPTLAGAKATLWYTYSDPDFMSNVYTEATTYAPAWNQETVELFVTEDDVLFLSWANPLECVVVANENVQLLPFSDIQKSVNKLIEYCTGNGGGSPILVKRIVLTSAIAQIPDQGNEAFLVPAWAFYMTSEQNEAEHIDMQILLINALDGTYIYRSLSDDGKPDI